MAIGMIAGPEEATHPDKLITTCCRLDLCRQISHLEEDSISHAFEIPLTIRRSATACSIS